MRRNCASTTVWGGGGRVGGAPGGLCFLGWAEEGGRVFRGGGRSRAWVSRGSFLRRCTRVQHAGLRDTVLLACWKLEQSRICPSKYYGAKPGGDGERLVRRGTGRRTQDADACQESISIVVRSMPVPRGMRLSSPQENKRRPLQSLNCNINQHKRQAKFLPAKEFKGEKELCRKFKGRQHHLHWEASLVADFTKI